MKSSDGKWYTTDVADSEQLFRLIQSIPSPKAEPFKIWLAQVASERLDEMADPEMTIDRALEQYLRLGYSENWINQRLKSIEIRKELTDEWRKRGMKEGMQFATLTDIITQAWSGNTTKEYKVLKGLKKENLRDNMTNTELILNMPAEASTKDIASHRTRDLRGQQRSGASGRQCGQGGSLGIGGPYREKGGDPDQREEGTLQRQVHNTQEGLAQLFANSIGGSGTAYS